MQWNGYIGYYSQLTTSCFRQSETVLHFTPPNQANNLYYLLIISMNSISCSSIDAKPSFINDTKCSLDSNAGLSSDINAKPRFDVNAAVNQLDQVVYSLQWRRAIAAPPALILLHNRVRISTSRQHHLNKYSSSPAYFYGHDQSTRSIFQTLRCCYLLPNLNTLPPINTFNTQLL